MKAFISPTHQLRPMPFVPNKRVVSAPHMLTLKVVAACCLTVAGCSGDEGDDATGTTATVPSASTSGHTAVAPEPLQPAGSNVTPGTASSTPDNVTPTTGSTGPGVNVLPGTEPSAPTTSEPTTTSGEPTVPSPSSEPEPGETPDTTPSNTSVPTEPPPTTDDSVSAEDDAGVAPEPDLVPNSFVCSAAPGTPPTGNLSTTRIESVNPTDNNFHLYEGAAWVNDGLYFSDINPNPWDSTIRRYDPSSGMATDFLVGAGSNGLAVGPNGVLHSATAGKQEISSYDLSTGMQQRVIGGMLNSPNDLAIAADGTIYFSDPQQGEIMPHGNQPQVVHVVKNGVDAVFSDQIQSPNGVTLSPDDSVLYVAGGGFFVKKVTLEDGLAGEIVDLITGLSTPDGMTKDCAGNLYIAEHNGKRILVVDPEGTEIASISVGESPTNVAFGGGDRKTLFVTAINSLWEVDLQIEGYPD